MAMLSCRLQFTCGLEQQAIPLHIQLSARSGMRGMIMTCESSDTLYAEPNYTILRPRSYGLALPMAYLRCSCLASAAALPLPDALLFLHTTNTTQQGEGTGCQRHSYTYLQLATATPGSDVIPSMVTSMPSLAAAPGSHAPAPLNIDMSVIKKLVNHSDINKLLHETLAKERAIDAELDKMLMKRGDLERNILSLNASTSEVGFTNLGEDPSCCSHQTTHVTANMLHKKCA
jgi:hypothetical protein